MKTRTLTSMAILICFTGLLNGQIINIPGDYLTIQAGIDAAAKGDTVLVAEGTWFENIDYKGKAITVASQFIKEGDTSYISKTIIDGSQPVDPDKASVVIMASGEDTTSVLCGFTIANGKGTYGKIGGLNHRTGCGILVLYSGGKIIHNIIENNTPDVSTHEYYKVFGIGLAGIVNNKRQLIVRDNIIRHNTFDDKPVANGGGIVIGGGPALVEYNTISNNLLTSDVGVHGGGVFYFPLENDATTTNKFILRNNKITGNIVSCPEGYTHAGGILFTGLNSPTDIIAYNNIIACNESKNNKGGGITVMSCNPVIFNNTIYNNKAQNGNQLYIMDEGSPFLYNNIIWSDSEIPEIVRENGAVTVAYCDVRGGFAGEGNIGADPMLDTVTFELVEGSSCIGAGTDSIEVDEIWYLAPAFDAAGNPRPDTIEGNVDIGAMEFQSTLTDINECILNEKSDLHIYPNPAKDYIFIQVEEPLNYTFEFISSAGQLMHTEEFFGTQKQVSLASHNEGIYFIRVRSVKNVWTGKVVKY